MLNPLSRALILIVEDDCKTSLLMSLYLKNEGFETMMASDGVEALSLWERHRPVFIILDLMIPRLDGIRVCDRVRLQSDVPIMMVTAKIEEADRLAGFSAGADDYVAKPFSPREIIARIKAILRRMKQAETAPPAFLSFRDLKMDLQKYKVTRNGVPVPLTHIEFKILQTLMGSPGHVFSRQTLLDGIYPNGEAVVLDRTIDVHIRNIREKIEPGGAKPCYIRTVHGLGYRFMEEAEFCLESA